MLITFSCFWLSIAAAYSITQLKANTPIREQIVQAREIQLFPSEEKEQAPIKEKKYHENLRKVYLMNLDPEVRQLHIGTNGLME